MCKTKQTVNQLIIESEHYVFTPHPYTNLQEKQIQVLVPVTFSEKAATKSGPKILRSPINLCSCDLRVCGPKSKSVHSKIHINF